MIGTNFPFFPFFNNGKPNDNFNLSELILYKF